MKKLILAAAIAATIAGAANAATIYEGNGLTYKLKGDFQVQLRQDAGDDQDLDIEFDDLELKNSVVYDLGDDMKAFGQVDFSFNSAADDDTKESAALEEAYLGLQFGDVAVSVGKQDLAVDAFGIENQYEDHEDQSQFAETGGDNVVRVDYAGANFTVTASTLVQAESEGDNVEGFDILAATSVADVELVAAYQDYNDNAGTEYDAWGVSAAFDAGFAAFGVDYSSADDKDANETNETYGLVAVVPVAETTDVSVGYTSTDNETATDVAEWYANVTYKFPTQKNVRLFAEIADTDAAGADLGYLAGMQLKF
ncbi:porin [Amphritea sp. HPY]|uniref:porin n=1 Tax=Amphritea sp. HPY TaxID=3421652 RepID=UPI003D7CE05D